MLNSSPPSATYMRQWTGSSLIQVMACRLFGAKPLPEPMLAYCQLDSWEHISVEFESEFCYFHSRKCIWKCRLPNWRPFCPGGTSVHGWLKIMRLHAQHRDCDNSNALTVELAQFHTNSSLFFGQKCLYQLTGPGFGCNFKCEIPAKVLVSVLVISKSILEEIMASCHQAPYSILSRHYDTIRHH